MRLIKVLLKLQGFAAAALHAIGGLNLFSQQFILGLCPAIELIMSDIVASPPCYETNQTQPFADCPSALPRIHSMY